MRSYRFHPGHDKWWHTRKYKGDLAIYARCKCGFEYRCSISIRNEDGSWNLKQRIDEDQIYPFCPNCGARKFYYQDKPTRIEQTK